MQGEGWSQKSKWQTSSPPFREETKPYRQQMLTSFWTYYHREVTGVDRIHTSHVSFASDVEITV